MKFPDFIILCLLVFYVSINPLHSQNVKVLKEDFKAAEYFLLNEEFEEALVPYLRILKENPLNANINYRIGLCYLNIPGKKVKSIPYLKYASTHTSEKYTESTFKEVNAPVQTLFLLGTAYQINNDFENARKAFNDYKKFLKSGDVNEISFVEKQINSWDIASKMMKEPVNIEIEVINKIIPSNQPAFYPVMSFNEDVFVYGTPTKFQCQVYFLKKQQDTWTKGINITHDIKSDGNCYPVSLSSDGTTLYMVRETNFDSDIYKSVYNDGKWIPMKKLENTINTKYWETYASISQDGRTLYFSSNRKGGFGGLDIYISALNNKEQWGPAVNLGKTINTLYNEDNPVITEDEKTLYFSSQGHDNMGGYDIFKSVKEGADKWSVPVNLGYPINTTDDNRYFYPLENGSKALYSGMLNPEDTFRNIKEIHFIPPITAKLINLKGKLTVQDNKMEVKKSFMIKILDKKRGIIADSLTSNPETGDYNINISPGNYSVEFSGSGYKPEIVDVSIPENYAAKDYVLNQNLFPVGAGLNEYTILLKISPNRLNSGIYKNLEEISGDTVKEQNMNGQYVYTLGSFFYKDMAEDYLKHSAFKTFARATVVNVKDILSMIPEMVETRMTRKYGIQVMALKNPHDLPEFNNSGLLKTHECTDGFFRYIYGEYNSIEKALEDLQMIKDKGYRKAFVINCNRLKSISLPEYVENKSKNYSGNYTIQLKASKSRLENKYFNNLDNVKIVESGDNIFRYVSGEFKTLNKAQNELARIRKMGYHDAFIRETESLTLYR